MAERQKVRGGGGGGQFNLGKIGLFLSDSDKGNGISGRYLGKGGLPLAVKAISRYWATFGLNHTGMSLALPVASSYLRLPRLARRPRNVTPRRGPHSCPPPALQNPDSARTHALLAAPRATPPSLPSRFSVSWLTNGDDLSRHRWIQSMDPFDVNLSFKELEASCFYLLFFFFFLNPFSKRKEEKIVCRFRGTDNPGKLKRWWRFTKLLLLHEGGTKRNKRSGCRRCELWV